MKTKQALIKLASLRLAINYVLRNRAMTKSADMAGSTEEIIPTYPSVEAFKTSGKPWNRGESIKMPQGQTLVNNYGEMSPDNESLNTYINTMQELNNVAPYYKRRGTTDTFQVPDDKDVGGWHEGNNDIVYNIGSNLSLYGTASHEPIHDYTPSIGNFLDNSKEAFPGSSRPLNIIGPMGNLRRFGSDLPVNSYLYEVEFPTTSDEWGANLLPELQGIAQGVRPSLPLDWSKDYLGKPLSYKGTMQSNPYMGYMPQVSPFGINHEFTPEEWASFTIPGYYDESANVFRETDETGTPTEMKANAVSRLANSTDVRADIPAYNSVSNYNLNLPTIIDFSSIPQVQEMRQKEKEETLTGKVEKLTAADEDVSYYSEEVRKSREQLESLLSRYKEEPSSEFAVKNITFWTDALNRDVENLNSALNKRESALREKEIIANDEAQSPIVAKYDYATRETPWVSKLFRENPEIYRQIILSNPFDKNSDRDARLNQMALYLSSAYNIERYPDAEKAVDFWFNKAGLSPKEREELIKRTKDTRSQLEAEKRYRNEYQLPLWLLNHARRGVNVINGELTPHAHLQGISQQLNPRTRFLHSLLSYQVKSKCNQYRDNPRYLNVMRRWELSPFINGDGMLGFNTNMLTIEQMKQILQDFEQEDNNYQLENSQQFQGYRFNPTA